jgi:hypothetical protein
MAQTLMARQWFGATVRLIMTKTRRITLALTLGALTGLGAITVSARSSAASDADAVRAVVNSSYCNGAYNALDTDAMARGFHPDFAIFGADGDKLERYPIADWIKAIKARKAKPGFDPASAKRECKLVTVDVTGSSAMVKAEISKDGKLVYTDYLSLLRFQSGWRIAAKVYTEH